PAEMPRRKRSAEQTHARPHEPSEAADQQTSDQCVFLRLGRHALAQRSVSIAPILSCAALPVMEIVNDTAALPWRTNAGQRPPQPRHEPRAAVRVKPIVRLRPAR